MLNERLIEIRYQSWKAEKRRRVAPLRLVLKGGSWHLAGDVDGSVRTYRVARVLDCIVLDRPIARPADFDLAAYWRASTERLEAELHPNQATVRLSPLGLELLEALSHPYVKARLRLAETVAPDGWRIATMPVGKTRWHAATELLRLGAEAEVLAPSELREQMAEMTAAMAARYAAPRARRPAAAEPERRPSLRGSLVTQWSDRRHLARTAISGLSRATGACRTGRASLARQHRLDFSPSRRLRSTSSQSVMG